MKQISRILVTGLSLALLFPVTGKAAPETAVVATPPALSLPVDCTVGKDCWVVNYPDHDNTKGATDLRCGMRSYDTHQGVDIALRDRLTMLSGTDVLAPADGTVKSIRNTMADHTGTKEDLDKARRENKECGNAIIMDLGNGWTARLCHLKQASILVSPGDTVKRGQKLAQVGMSGLTQFSHLHIDVKKEGKVIDPFTGQSQTDSCTPPGAPLPGHAMWTQDSGLAYSAVDLFAAGFSNNLPKYQAVAESAYAPSSLPASSQIMAFWFMGYGLAPGDKITISIFDPRGNVYAENHQVHERNSSRYMYFVGQKTSKSPLIPGIYTGIATLERKMPGGKTLRREIKKKVTIR